jgi:hypothetical protein
MTLGGLRRLGAWCDACAQLDRTGRQITGRRPAVGLTVFGRGTRNSPNAFGQNLRAEEVRTGRRRLAALLMRKFLRATKSSSITASLRQTSETVHWQDAAAQGAEDLNPGGNAGGGPSESMRRHGRHHHWLTNPSQV